jgi:GAF domain-containing protein
VDRTPQLPSISSRLLTRWGGRYVLRMQILAGFASYLLIGLGIYYIILASNLNKSQIQMLVISTALLIILAVFLMSVYSALASKHMRQRLDNLTRNKITTIELSPEDLEGSAWQEANRLPGTHAILEIVTIAGVVVLPVVLLLRWAGGAGAEQAIQIALGGLSAGLLVVILNSLLLKTILWPIYNLLLPAETLRQSFKPGRWLQALVPVTIFTLTLVTVTLVGFLGYHLIQATTQSEPSISALIESSRDQLATLGISILAISLLMGMLVSRSASLPIQDVIDTIKKIQKGDLSARATLFAPDQTAQMTLLLNQLLDQFMAGQVNMEKQVETRTADLNRKTAQLQAAARVFREASIAEDLTSLLTHTVNSISHYFDLYHIGIFLVDETSDFLILRAASSSGGQKLVSELYKLELGQSSAPGIAASENRPVVVFKADRTPTFRVSPDLPLSQTEAAFPLTSRGKSFGVLDLQFSEHLPLTPDDIDIFQSMADQISLAIQNAKLVEESRTAADQLSEALAENTRSVWSKRTEEQKRIYRYTPRGLAVMSSEEASATANNHPAKTISIPVTLRGQSIGEIVLRRLGDSPWGDADRSLALEVSNQLGLALENSRLLQEAQQRTILEQTLSKLTTQLGRSIDTDTLLQTTVKELHQLPDVTEVSVFLSPPENPSTGDRSQP